jgi:hypothetical protein
VLAGLFEVEEAETPYGGMAVTYEPLGHAWLKMGARRRRERTEAGRATSVETTTAETRVDPRLRPGRVLRFGGADWTIVLVEVEAERPGRAKLSLERRPPVKPEDDG